LSEFFSSGFSPKNCPIEFRKSNKKPKQKKENEIWTPYILYNNNLFSKKAGQNKR